MKFMSNQELKFFLYIQVICLFFAAVGLSLREFMVVHYHHSVHWFYPLLMIMILFGLVLLFLTRHRSRQILLRLSLYYCVISIVLGCLIFIRM